MLTLSKHYRSSASNAIGIKFLLNRVDANRYAAIVVGSNDTWGRRTYFDFYTQSAGNNIPRVRMRINHNGYVGIGTTSPTEMLTVNGTIRAEEVIVVENVGADFVFDEEYKLPDLSRVEAYIKQHKHLPGIPSAEKMKKNGVRMGALQMKLLQKIEELTLYVIELKKENKQLKKYIDVKLSKQQ